MTEFHWGTAESIGGRVYFRATTPTCATSRNAMGVGAPVLGPVWLLLCTSIASYALGQSVTRCLVQAAVTLPFIQQCPIPLGHL